MRVVKSDRKVYYLETLSNLTHHSYTYNRLYNNTWRSLTLQLIPCLENKEQGNKQLKGGYK